jgi:pimeloyl-ACP methyl ester carboxylesterase
VACGTLLGAITATPDEPFDPLRFAALAAPPRAPRAGAERRPGPPVAPAPALASAASSPASPAARARARELGVEIGRVRGSGPGGRIVREDVEAFAEARRRLRPASGGVALEVPSQGEGPPVVLLPGFGTDVACFAPLVSALAERFAVLGVNPRGVGLSDAPDLAAYDVGTAAEDVAALAPARFHAVGASLGAAVALELALRHPERVERLVLVTPFVEAGARLLAVVDLWTRAAAEAAPETLARILLPWLFSERLLADEGARERTLRGLAASLARVPAATLARAAAGLRAWSGSRRGALGRIAAPTLVVAGEADLLTPEGAAIAGAVPGARLLLVPGAGHGVALECAARVNLAVSDHLG